MAIGKYVTNVGVITTVLGGFGVAKQTRDMPKDWRRFLIWGVWGASVTLRLHQFRRLKPMRNRSSTIRWTRLILNEHKKRSKRLRTKPASS